MAARGSTRNGRVRARGVEMSTPSTGHHTREVLPAPTALLRTLRDVDTWEDARAVAAEVPHTRFAAAVSEQVPA